MSLSWSKTGLVFLYREFLYGLNRDLFLVSFAIIFVSFLEVFIGSPCRYMLAIKIARYSGIEPLA
jgi:hypothetical protein